MENKLDLIKPTDSRFIELVEHMWINDAWEYDLNYNHFYYDYKYMEGEIGNFFYDKWGICAIWTSTIKLNAEGRYVHKYYVSKNECGYWDSYKIVSLIFDSNLRTECKRIIDRDCR